MTLREFAKTKFALSPIMEGKEKIQTSDVINQEITISDFDLLTDHQDGTQYVVITMREYPNNFLFGGQVLTELCQDLYEKFGDDVHTMLQQEGLKIRLTSKQSKNSKRPYTAVEVL